MSGGVRCPGLSSGLLSAQEVEHDVVYDVVGRGRLDMALIPRARVILLTG